MKTYRVVYRRPDHRDEWANEYLAWCVRTEEGEFVYPTLESCQGGAWANIVVLPQEDILRFEVDGPSA